MILTEKLWNEAGPYEPSPYQAMGTLRMAQFRVTAAEECYEQMAKDSTWRFDQACNWLYKTNSTEAVWFFN